MKSILVLSVLFMIGTAGFVAAEEPAAPAEPLIKMSEGSAKIIGEPAVKMFPAMNAAVVLEKAESYTPEGGYTMDEAGVAMAYQRMMESGFGKLMKWAHETGTFPSGPAFGMYYEDPTMTEPGKLTAKVAFPVAGDASGNEDVKIEEVPEMTAVMVQFEGPYEQGNNAWKAAMDWTEANGYEWAGAPMEIYLKGPMDVQDEKEYLTEIRIPVMKAETPKE